jgi:amino acid transporter
VPVVATIALGAALLWGDRRLAAYVGLLVLLIFAGGVWSTVGFEELAITADESGNPIVRYTGSMILLSAVVIPLLLTSVWRGDEDA